MCHFHQLSDEALDVVFFLFAGDKDGAALHPNFVSVMQKKQVRNYNNSTLTLYLF
jgi:hypothetical protein